MDGNWQEEVLDFWFQELTPQQWFAGGDALDAQIAQRFSGLLAELTGQIPASALLESEAALAAILALDQFSRNMFRGTANAFAQDSLAAALTHNALRQGFDRAMTEQQRMFLYMPLMHSEQLADQELCVRLFRELGNQSSLTYAMEHRDVIARFGRFPHRNAALRMQTTPDEVQFLEGANRYGQ